MPEELCLRKKSLHEEAHPASQRNASDCGASTMFIRIFASREVRGLILGLIIKQYCSSGLNWHCASLNVIQDLYEDFLFSK